MSGQYTAVTGSARGSGGHAEAAHRRIEAHLRELIAQGEGQEGRLPTEQELASQFGVSRPTVRQAFQSLVSAGLIVRHRARGSFVTPRISEDVSTMGRVSFPDRWATQGHTLRMEVLVYELRPATAEIGRDFGVPLGANVCYLERLRWTDGQPTTWDVRYLPPRVKDMVAREELERESLYFILPQRGIPISDAGFEITARAANTAEARLLHINPGSTVLVRDIMFSGPDAKAVISGVSLYPAERVSYRVKLSI